MLRIVPDILSITVSEQNFYHRCVLETKLNNLLSDEVMRSLLHLDSACIKDRFRV